MKNAMNSKLTSNTTNLYAMLIFMVGVVGFEPTETLDFKSSPFTRFGLVTRPLKPVYRNMDTLEAPVFLLQQVHQS
jgi:hypothetical protein